MIIQICEHCKRFMNENEVKYPITIQHSSIFTEHKQVCIACYSQISEQDDSRLLVE